MRKVTEKAIEKALCDAVKKKGGWAVKMVTSQVSGLPDRLCLMPGGRAVFVELKAPGKTSRKLQILIQSKIRNLGFEVLEIDSLHGVTKFIRTI